MARFYLDENVAESLGELLRRHGHDVLTVREAGSKGATDVRQLLFACRTGRITVTYDAGDFKMLHEAWLLLAREWLVERNVLHPGVLVLPPPRKLDNDMAAAVIDVRIREGNLTNELLIWKHPTGWVPAIVA